MKRNKLTAVLSGFLAVAVIFTGKAIQAAPDKVSQDEMLNRYERAQHLIRGVRSNHVVQNSVVYPRWIGKSDKFFYLRELKDGADFRLVDVKKKTNKPAFDHKALAKALAKATGKKVDAKRLHASLREIRIHLAPVIVQFETWDKGYDNSPGMFSSKPEDIKTWTYDERSKSLTRNKAGGKPFGWYPSPDGKLWAFVKDYNIWVKDRQTGEERALTTDGQEFYQYGHHPLGAGHFLNARWSPDSKRLLTFQGDVRQVKQETFMNYIPANNRLRPDEIKLARIARPGDKHVLTYKMVSLDVETATEQAADYKAIPRIMVGNPGDGYFNQDLGWWNKDNRLAYFIDIDRYHKHVRVVEFDTDTGATRVLFGEKSDKAFRFIGGGEDKPLLMPLQDSDELLWYSERSGWGHYYLYDLKTGKMKNEVTNGDWLVRYPLRFDAKRRELFLQTAGRTPGRDPYYRDLARVNIDTGKITTLISGDYEHYAISPKSNVRLAGNSVRWIEKNPISTIVWRDRILWDERNLNNDYPGSQDISPLSNGVSPSGNYVVVTRSRVNTVPVSYVVDRQGQKVMELEVADISNLPTGWQWPEPVKVIAADGKTDLYGVVYRPSDFDPSQTYPVVNLVRNGNMFVWTPKGSFNTTNVSYFPEAALAELGFVVVQLDGRGSPYRSKAFMDHNYGTLDVNMADQVAGLKQVAGRYPYMDMDRVGITTLSVAHFTSAPVRGLLEYPDFYKVGISRWHARGATDIYLEKFIGRNGPLPETRNPLGMVDKLQGKLMMTITLPKLQFASETIPLLHAFQLADRDVDTLVTSISFGGYVTQRHWNYLVRHLQGNEPPKGFILGDFNPSLPVS